MTSQPQTERASESERQETLHARLLFSLNAIAKPSRAHDAAAPRAVGQLDLLASRRADDVSSGCLTRERGCGGDLRGCHGRGDDDDAFVIEVIPVNAAVPLPGNCTLE